ncbi:adenylate/guanylate cyclase domain-containing protein [Salinibius halmophilus]|uniref:adenylate/guanylate cyclase domain-containing protein n=1 Tax=Salinibius halmophilus TaxID=1853216 RepID=UPI000E6604FC|nr:adenylate/guanylate cyclase domain-containing protein [Salinibius halmophilus]
MSRNQQPKAVKAKQPSFADARQHDFNLRPKIYARYIAYLTLAFVTMTATWRSGVPLWVVPILAWQVIYPYASSVILRQRSENPERTSQVLTIIDSVFFGAMVGLLSNYPITGLLIIIMANASYIALGSILIYFISLITTVAAAILVFQGKNILQVGNIEQISNVTPYVCGIGAGIYIAVTSYFSTRHAQTLIQTRQQLEQQSREYRNLSRQIAKYISPQVWQTIFSGKRDVKLENQRKRLVVFFSDIKGFTEMSEMLEPEALTSILNEYLNEMSKIALRYGGTIDKFMGDAVMVFFGDPETKGVKQDAESCVAMALEMRRTMHHLYAKWRKQGITQGLEIRMGINAGYCTVGNFGAETRLDYTIIGKEVNLASRLETAASSGEILISSAVYELVKDTISCREKDPISVKGFTRPVPVFSVVDHRRELGSRPSFTNVDMDGFFMQLDLQHVKNYDIDRINTALEKAREAIQKSLI